MANNRIKQANIFPSPMSKVLFTSAKGSSIRSILFIGLIGDTHTDGLMLAKVNSLNEQTYKVNVTLLDVDVLVQFRYSTRGF